MLLTPVEELTKIQKQENNFSFIIGNTKKKIEYDHLPFANKILKIAENLENAPNRPEIKFEINLEYYFYILMRLIVKFNFKKGIFINCLIDIIINSKKNQIR